MFELRQKPAHFGCLFKVFTNASDNDSIVEAPPDAQSQIHLIHQTNVIRMQKLESQT